MIVSRSGEGSFTLEFESEDEVRAEHATNLMHGALRLPTAESAALHAALSVLLRGPWGGETIVRATVVASLGDALALGVEGYTDESLAALLMRPEPAVDETPRAGGELAATDDDGERKQTVWDRVRGLSQMEKILLAVKAERTERALMLQDNDPRVLLSLLRNPRITVEEIARLARSPFLTYQVADVIVKSALWMGNLDVRVGLVHNPKTPQAFALRILPTLPENDVRAIARAGTSMALKQAALRRLQGK
ncbi:MAG: hypothetical protein WC538_02865 [Thermoanaerobaculia bacterium]|jgi:hypothetical protein